MMTNKTTKLLDIAILLTITFIWTHSMMPVDVSSTESSGVLAFLNIFFHGALTELFVRKAAHFTEYAVLGGLLSAREWKVRGSLLGSSGACKRILGTGFIVAFLDETIQIFSGRGSKVQDVWLDFSGVVFSLLIALLLSKVRNRNKEPHHEM